MARRKPVRRARGVSRTKRNSHRAFSWQRFWSDLGLKPVYQYWKKWPYSKPFTAFLGSFFFAVLALTITDGGSRAPGTALNTDSNTGIESSGQTNSFAENIDSWSEWVQNKYAAGQWNEATWNSFGAAPNIADSAPMTSKVFNCTTYVETVGALARSSDYSDFYSNLVGIRYDGKGTGYLNRNHFPEADWIPNNSESGRLVDITHSVARQAGLMARVEEKTIDKGRWLARQMGKGSVDRTLASMADGSWRTPTSVQVSYIPLDEVDRVAPFIPNGAVINLVRENNTKHDLLIGHQGFFIRKNGQAMFRHSTTKGKVQTVSLKAYFGLQQKRDWPLIGINVNAFTPGNGSGFTPN